MDNLCLPEMVFFFLPFHGFGRTFTLYLLLGSVCIRLLVVAFLLWLLGDDGGGFVLKNSVPWKFQNAPG